MKKRINIKSLLGKPLFLWEKFHAQTKIKNIEKNKSKYWPDSWYKIYYKAYPRLDEIRLPHPTISRNYSIKDSLVQRQSLKKFSKITLSINILSSLLFYSAGLKDINHQQRFYPSAGARYPLEIYIISLDTEIPKGVYHYYLKNHSLEQLLTFDHINLEGYFNQAWIKQARCLILISAVFQRTTSKYSERGYRYVLIEAGHLAQNFYLTSNTFRLSCCAVGGYSDYQIDSLLNLDSSIESVIYVLAIG